MFLLVVETTYTSNQTMQINRQSLIRVCEYFDYEEK